MRHSQLQVILVSKYSLRGMRYEQLDSWLQTTAQSIIKWQQQMEGTHFSSPK